MNSAPDSDEQQAFLRLTEAYANEYAAAQQVWDRFNDNVLSMLEDPAARHLNIPAIQTLFSSFQHTLYTDLYALHIQPNRLDWRRNMSCEIKRLGLFTFRQKAGGVTFMRELDGVVETYYDME